MLKTNILLAEDDTQASQSFHHTDHFVLIFLFQEDFLKGSFRFIGAKWERSTVLKTSDSLLQSWQQFAHYSETDKPWWILDDSVPLAATQDRRTYPLVKSHTCGWYNEEPASGLRPKIGLLYKALWSMNYALVAAYVTCTQTWHTPYQAI